MAAKKGIDWSDVDWSLSYSEIARRVGVTPQAVWVAAQKRKPPKTKRGPYRDTDARCARLARVRNRDNAAATKAAKKSPRAKRGIHNVHAKRWVMIDPEGRIHNIRNLYHFVRRHPELFAPADVVWKRTGGKRGSGGEYCNATAGLFNVRAGKSRCWKGWTLKD